MEADKIKPDDIENVLGEKVFFTIPNNYYTLNDSIEKGLPVSEIAPDSNLSKSFKQLAALLSDNYSYNGSKHGQINRENKFNFLGLFNKK